MILAGSIITRARTLSLRRKAAMIKRRLEKESFSRGFVLSSFSGVVFHNLPDRMRGIG
jgi:hypothetical protein